MKTLHKRIAASFVSAVAIATAAAHVPAQAQVINNPAVIPPVIDYSPSADPTVAAVIVRLPPQAGFVTHAVKLSKVFGRTPSWITKGDKYFSLCVPVADLISCKPIVATPIMQDIYVTTRIDENGRPAVVFHVDPLSRRPAHHLPSAMDYFLMRTHLQVRYFATQLKNAQPNLRAGTGTKAKHRPLNSTTNSTVVDCAKMNGRGGGDELDGLDEDCSNHYMSKASTTMTGPINTIPTKGRRLTTRLTQTMDSVIPASMAAAIIFANKS